MTEKKKLTRTSDKQPGTFPLKLSSKNWKLLLPATIANYLIWKTRDTESCFPPDEEEKVNIKKKSGKTSSYFPLAIILNRKPENTITFSYHQEQNTVMGKHL